MAKLILQNQTEPTSPDAGCTTLYVDSCDGKTKVKNNSGCINVLSCIADINACTKICCGNGVPSSTPDYIGQRYINTNSIGGLYLACSASGWKYISGGKTVAVTVVGGGGGGSGATNGGGGGGGGVINCYYNLTSTCIPVVVGAGGAGGVNKATQTGGNGGYSCFGTLCIGGGTGGNGSAGGTSGNGYAGGGINYGCGGGGAGGVGGARGKHYGGDGVMSILEFVCSDYLYGAGGTGGHTYNCSCWTEGGNYGGGCGGDYSGSGYPATRYGGGGGGAAQCCYACGGDGCQGIVLVGYPVNSNINATGGTISVKCGYKIHTFTSNGNFCIL